MLVLLLLLISILINQSGLRISHPKVFILENITFVYEFYKLFGGGASNQIIFRDINFYEYDDFDHPNLIYTIIRYL